MPPHVSKRPPGFSKTDDRGTYPEGYPNYSDPGVGVVSVSIPIKPLWLVGVVSVSVSSLKICPFMGAGYSPPMQKIVMSWSESGGETKSTLAVHLAAGLAIRGKSVALVDLDPQGTASLHLGFPEESIGDCVGSAGLIKGRKTQTLLEYEPKGRGLGKPFWLAPSTPALYALAAGRGYSNHSKFREALKALDVEFVVLDAGPGFSNLTIAGLVVADEILVPVRARSSKGLDGIHRVREALEVIRPDNPSIRIGGFILSEVSGGRKLVQDVETYLRKTEKKVTYKSKVRESMKIPEALSGGITVFDHDGRRDGPAGDYLSVTDEFLRRHKRAARKTA